MNKWLIGGAVAGVTLLGYGLIRKANAAPTQTKTEPAVTITKSGEKVPTVDLKTLPGYTAGFIEGHEDGYGDGIAGVASNPRPNLSYSTIPTEQSAHDLGYDAGYAEGRDAGLAFKSFTTDSTGTPDDTKTVVAKEKEKVGTDADRKRGSNDGQSDGYYAGNKDQQDGVGDPSGSSSNRFHNLKNAVAGLPRSDAYKAGYGMGLDAGYSNGYNDALHGVTVGGFAQCRKSTQAQPSALASVGRLTQRIPLWQGGRRISAVSGFGDRYRRFSSKLEQYLRPGTPLTINVVNTAGTSTAGT